MSIALLAKCEPRLERRGHRTMRTGEILGVAADRASREFAPTRDDLLNAQLGIEVDRLALGDQEWRLGRWGRMKIEEVVASLEKRLQLLAAEEFVTGPVHLLAISVAKQAVHVELEIALLGCQRLLIGTHEGKSAALQNARSAKEVEEELLDCVNATDFVAMNPAEKHGSWPAHIAGNPHDIIDGWIFLDDH